MRSSRLWLVTPVLVLFAGAASGNDELIKLSKDPNQWVMPSGDYANTRYSTLNQITKDNVKNLRPLWTFSTGVLRGHEGGRWSLAMSCTSQPRSRITFSPST
jgi:glucose dehydrogenase